MKLIEQLIEAIYAAAVGKITWEHFLEKLALELPQGRAALIVHSTRNRDGYALFSDDGRLNNAYNGYYARINPLQPILAAKPIGFIGCDIQLLEREKLERTKFYNDFLMVNRMRRTAGFTFAKSGNEVFSLIVGCDASFSADPFQDIMKTLSGIMPHLQRAFDMRSRNNDTISRYVPTLMDAVNVGALVLDKEQRVESISNLATRILDEGEPFSILVDGRIRFRQQEIKTTCSAMLKRNYSGSTMQGFFSHGTKISIIRLNKDRSSLYFEGAAAVVLVRQFKQRSSHYDQQLFGADFKLSKGEMRALAGIVYGKSMNDVASEAGLSRETIRSQFKSLYAKIGARGEADVLRLLHQGWQKAEPKS